MSLLRKLTLLIMEKYNEIMGSTISSRRKILAGVVMTTGPYISKGKVICLSTGTKCHVTSSGEDYESEVSDCHAEVVSRRCLIDFLYNQLYLHLDEKTAEKSIFKRPDKEGDLYELKWNIRFHLYISTAPCGDGRVFSFSDSEQDYDSHPSRKSRGLLRAKIDRGESSIPVKKTIENLPHGQRLLNMSCSDKIAKWNVLGFQGSLLSSIIKPVYFNSIVVGGVFHKAHLYRAVCGRLGNSIPNLPSPFSLNSPNLLVASVKENPKRVKLSKYSMNWICGNEEVEIISSITGKTTNRKISRICKKSFHLRYVNLIESLPFIKVGRIIDCSYDELKERAKKYQFAKKTLFLAFQNKSLGTWLKRSSESSDCNGDDN